MIFVPLPTIGATRAVTRNTAFMTTAIASCLVLGSSAAQAAGPPQQPPRPADYSASASECLSGAAEYNDYVGSFRADLAGNHAYLYCGYETGPTGVWHTHSGSNPHPIDKDGGDDDSLYTCVENFGSYGYNVGEDPKNENNYIVEMPLKKGTARIVYDVNSYAVVTVFTDGRARNNDWHGCAYDLPGSSGTPGSTDQPNDTAPAKSGL